MSAKPWTMADMPILAMAMLRAVAKPDQSLASTLKDEALKTAIMCAIDAFVTLAEYHETDGPRGRATEAMLLLSAQYFIERGYTYPQAAETVQRFFTCAWEAAMSNRLRGRPFDLENLHMEKFDA